MAVKLHISTFQMPDGMYIATCAEIPMCRALRQNKGHAVQDVKQQIRRFLAERQAENRPFEPEPLLEIEIEAPNGA
ncbi:hypothetical protein [Alicyclobacillus acidocaldarius]|uniref:Type II toxin-antitoxin system HicB family antitoxin n=1 Tax=Alicyclobacillus acidocaldarius subsp. acidocaldarius (strain ATCC 27009 / DSM 446 / BCRC 14685 / JCM 5260 / KCTC 1825 / NBRC 15652 / NCIMB 11725 / NRRL B-14509 / 104-IA) TaxID=521098 RepID=C8WQ50_ALIAD|nr:hypothetical protein [Alicyclobacillus acidocaldarius]ACV57154.1 hypothetical protein Aaci_0090 [Alicyclobacillus acidocaldarius subsp. acidocaldarius DSM 446]